MKVYTLHQNLFIRSLGIRLYIPLSSFFSLKLNEQKLLTFSSCIIKSREPARQLTWDCANIK